MGNTEFLILLSMQPPPSRIGVFNFFKPRPGPQTGVDAVDPETLRCMEYLYSGAGLQTLYRTKRAFKSDSEYNSICSVNEYKSVYFLFPAFDTRGPNNIVLVRLMLPLMIDSCFNEKHHMGYAIFTK